MSLREHLSVCDYHLTVFVDFIAKGIMIIYVDDIIISSLTVSESYDRLNEVLGVANSFDVLFKHIGGRKLFPVHSYKDVITREDHQHGHKTEKLVKKDK